MKCQSLFSEKNKTNIMNLSSAECDSREKIDIKKLLPFRHFSYLLMKTLHVY